MLKEQTLLDTIPLRDAYRALLDAAVTVADASDADADPAAPDGEWNADQILAHVALIGAATIAAVAAITAGSNTTYDNRLSADAWTIEQLITLADGNAGLRDRIGRQADALCTLSGPGLSDAELGVLVPTRLVSHDTLLLDQPVPLRDILTGLAEQELPGHTQQLLALLPSGIRAGAAT
jgi:hypothetical protein